MYLLIGIVVGGLALLDVMRFRDLVIWHYL